MNYLKKYEVSSNQIKQNQMQNRQDCSKRALILVSVLKNYIKKIKEMQRKLLAQKLKAESNEKNKSPEKLEKLNTAGRISGLLSQRAITPVDQKMISKQTRMMNQTISGNGQFGNFLAPPATSSFSKLDAYLLPQQSRMNIKSHRDSRTQKQNMMSSTFNITESHQQSMQNLTEGKTCQNQTSKSKFNKQLSQSAFGGKTQYSQSTQSRRQSQQAKFRAHPLIQEILDKEMEKVDKERARRLRIIRLQVEHNAQMQIKLKQKQKRIKKADNDHDKNLNSHIETITQKRNARSSEQRKRANLLSQDYDNQIQGEIERQNQLMTMRETKVQILQSERKQYLKQRDLELQEKLRQIRDEKKQNEELENEQCESNLKSIKEKLSRSQMKHEQFVKQRIDEAKQKNQHAVGIFHKHQKSLDILKEHMTKKLETSDENHRKFIADKLDEYRNQLDEIKQQSEEKYQMNHTRRQLDQKAYEERLGILQKQQEEVRDYKEQVRREQNKEFMLQNEYRRLKSEDIRKLRERQKRLDQTKKYHILQKDKDHQELLKHLHEGEQLIFKKKIEMSVKTIKDTDEIKNKLVDAKIKKKTLTDQTKEMLGKEGIHVSDDEQTKKKKQKKIIPNYDFYSPAIIEY
ncbi:UNKNOWN [Stylonychia lemnae]|uniref:Uncharacterized protein n=1 Tax=Stylonychia lemnae TaxID=5949 RepID=A0A078AH93_STYLE|nr:UNKNOWN [Stylonychia lemnae]|eukprot:CDW80213.1 UNKNOWN [Stylonychia lemnae]